MGRAIATTNWGLVFAARTDHPDRRREALAGLYQLYWYPLYAFIRRQGQSQDEAADLVQAFFVHLIEREALASVDPALGRFRAFLLVSLKNFLSNEHDRQQAKRRGGGALRLPIEAEDTDRRYQSGDATADPERLFERQWALTVVGRALERLRTRYAGMGKGHEFEVLSSFLTSSSAQPTYVSAAAALGASDGAVRTALHRLRQRFGKALREEVAETVAHSSDIDAELRFLFAALDT